jgi:hypothetical protein
VSEPAARQRRALIRHLPALALFVLASVGMTWPLVTRIDETLISWGDPVFQSWTMAWNWHALTTDPRDVFDANIFYPWRNTLAYADHLFGQTLTVLPVYPLTGNGVLAINIAVLIAFVLSSLAMYLLVYDITGNRLAGILAGLAYAYAPSRMAHIEHLNLLSAQWAPLVLLCLRRVVTNPTPPTPLPRGERGEPVSNAVLPTPPSPRRGGGLGGWGWPAALALTLFLQGLSGIYFFSFTLLMLLLAGAVYAGFALAGRDRGMLRRLLAAAGACALACLLLLPTLLPHQRVRDDLGIERAKEEVAFWSATWGDYLAVAPTNRAWNERLAGNHRHIEQDLFPGIIVLCLAGIGLTHGQAGRMRWVLLTVALGSVVLSFGPTLSLRGAEIPGPYELFYDYVPGFRAIRVPARLGLFALVGVAALAGLGVDRLWRLGRDELPYFAWYPNLLARRPRHVALLAFAAALAGLWLETVTLMHLPGPVLEGGTRRDYEYIHDHPAPTLELPMGEGLIASAWPNYFSMLHWSEVVNGYSSIVPPTYYPFRERIKDFPSDDTLLLLQGIGVENVIIHGELPTIERAVLEAAIRRQDELSLGLPGPDAVYHLRRDPWMWELAAQVPDGATVDLPNAAADPVAFGLLLAILQRTGHDVTGRGQVDYYRFAGADAPQCYVILLARDRPTAFGYVNVEVVETGGNMVLYRRDGCE